MLIVVVAEESARSVVGDRGRDVMMTSCVHVCE
jgi:hypothetical protein